MKLSAITLLTVLTILLLTAAQCGAPPPPPNSPPPSPLPTASGPTITAAEVWARPSAMPGGNGAVYMKLMNGGDSDDSLLKAESNIAATIELHETTMEGDVMRMQPIAQVSIPAGGTATLEPGGKHIMLLGLKQELTPGTSFTVTLHFEHAAPLTLAAEVRDAAMPTMEGGAGGGMGTH